MDLGVLLSVPLESLAIRAVLATLLAAVAVRLLLRSGLRTPRARVAAAVAPLLTLVAVVVFTGTQLRLPTLMLPAEGARSLSIPVADGYLYFVPIAVPVIVGLWILVATSRLGRRLLAHASIRRRAAAAVRATPTPPVRLERLTRSVAAALEVPVPRLGVVAGCRGGAYVVGVRRPRLVIDDALLLELDDEELEGVLAHELAHVRRRDTSVAAALGTVRDLMFFVPGGGWAVRQLHRERELAADQLAVGITARPGALASGLLKVLDRAPEGPSPCAALAPAGGVVDRVRVLVDEQASPGSVRRFSETSAVVVVTVAAVTSALVVPGLMAGTDHQREALAFVWSATPASPDAPEPVGESRAFDVYRRSTLEISELDVRPPGNHVEPSQDYRRAAMRACVEDACPAPSNAPSLGLRPPAITYDDEALARWEARPVGNFETDDGFRLFWLANQSPN